MSGSRGPALEDVCQGREALTCSTDRPPGSYRLSGGELERQARPDQMVGSRAEPMRAAGVWRKSK